MLNNPAETQKHKNNSFDNSYKDKQVTKSPEFEQIKDSPDKLKIKKKRCYQIK